MITQSREEPRQETGDGRLFLFILPTSPRPHVPTSPRPHVPTSPLPHPSLFTVYCLLITEKG
ncbi:MAG: hypothetical protein EWV56_03010 [Microcystis aeruginosa Ma_QC_C_20070823_S13D]|nr:MAG: hypothetical protein EWV56_03010 [Microcystis aeruginosa Ma_QC_C_20070823_S13D]